MSMFNSTKGGKFSFVKTIAIFVALVMAISAFMVSCGNTTASEEKKDGVNEDTTVGSIGDDIVVDDVTDNIEIDDVVEDEEFLGYTTVNLYPDREVSVEDFEAYAEEVDKNISYYGNDYSVINYDNYIEVIVNKAYTYDSMAILNSMFDAENYSFDVVIDVIDEPNWQTDEDDMGKYQVTFMNDNAVIFQYCLDEYDRDEEYEDYVTYEASIKEKLDALGINYMYGTAAYDPYTYCIKVYPEDFAPDFARVIFGDNSSSIYTTYEQTYLSNYADMEVVNEEGFYALRFATYYSPEEIAEKYTLSNDKLYLVINDVTVASATLSEMYKLDYWYIDFKDFLCFDSPEITENELNVLKMFATIANSDNYSYMSGGTYGIRFSDEYSDLSELNWKYTSFTNEDIRVNDIISEMGHGFVKQFDGRNEIVVVVDVPYDKNLATNFINEVKALYTACNFDSCAYNEIVFTVADETAENPSNQFRITAKKNSYDSEGMKMDFYVSGPKYSKYNSTFREIYEAETLFTERAWY